MTDVILVLNAGSSSIKFCAVSGRAAADPARIWSARANTQGIGHRVHFTAKDGAGAPLADEYLADGATHEDALAALLRWLAERFPAASADRGGASRRSWRDGLSRAGADRR